VRRIGRLADRRLDAPSRTSQFQPSHRPGGCTMKRRILFLYQILTGLSDSSTGLLLILSPAFTLHLMRLHAASDALPFLSYIGAFVLSVGIACLYGALLTTRSGLTAKL